VDEKIAVKDAGSDLRQIAATLLETEQVVEARAGAKARELAGDARAAAEGVVGEAKGAAREVKVRPTHAAARTRECV